MFESDYTSGIECIKHIPVSMDHDEILFTCHSNGKIKKWKIDHEQNCDIYKIQVNYNFTIKCHLKSKIGGIPLSQEGN